MSDKELKVIELEGTTYVPKILWDTGVEAIEVLEKQVEELQEKLGKSLDIIIDLRIKYEPEKFKKTLNKITKFLKD